MRRSLAMLMLLGATAAASGADAQGFLTTIRNLGLNNDDFRIASAEAAKLYEFGADRGGCGHDLAKPRDRFLREGRDHRL